MRLFRRPAPPQRRPHPDPRTEAVLQRIISLQQSVTRKQDMLDRNHRQISRMREDLRAHPVWERAPAWRDQVAILQQESRDLEAEITRIHDEIAERAGSIDDSDLAWLAPG